MHKLEKTLRGFGRILTDIVSVRLPMSVWLDSGMLHLYRTRL